MRRPSLNPSYIVIPLLALFSPISAAEQFDPVGLFLTWQQDPTTTMTIDWHTLPGDGERSSVLQYKERGSDTWHEAEGDARPFPFSDRTIHRVEVTGLAPATTYRFRFGDDSVSYLFRTMPATLEEPIVFINGGDTLPTDHFREMNAVAASYDPEFIFWGGDLAYGDGNPLQIQRWYNWFDGIKADLIDDEGRVIPIVVTIGNHEIFREAGAIRVAVRSGMSEDEAKAFFNDAGLQHGDAPFYFTLFAFPGEQGYNVLDFGDYLSLIALDSAHYVPIEGDQTDWLRQTLAERAGRPHIFPFYHVPAYPSARPFSTGASRRIRVNWVPLFEEFGVQVAFEHHDHTYKRTHPLLGGEINEQGIIYLGDGAWGVSRRDFRDEEPQLTYINKFEKSTNGIIISIDYNQREFKVVNQENEVLDQFSIPVRR